MLKENYDAVRAEIDAACARSGRSPREVTLIAVSKTKPLEMIRELADAGVTDFGENKVQELSDKHDRLAEPAVRWHMIGHLQRNKVKYLEDRAVALIHSVDSLRLAEEIEKEAAKRGLVQPVLLEVNIGAEESKSGCAPEKVKALAQAVSALPHLSIRGLMCVAPACGEPEEVRPCFARMRTLRDEIRAFVPSCTELSMGMTGDYRVAVEEGATLVRVGSAIFGARDYSA